MTKHLRTGGAVAVTAGLALLGAPGWITLTTTAVTLIAVVVSIVRSETRIAASHTDQDLWLRMHAHSGTDWNTLPWNVDRLKAQQEEAIALAETIRRRVERQNRPALPIRAARAVRGRTAQRAIEQHRDEEAWWKQ